MIKQSCNSTSSINSKTHRERERAGEMSTEGIFEAAKAHYAALSGYGKQEMWSRFAAMHSNGDGKLSRGDYSNFLTQKKCQDNDLFDLLDKNGDGVLDFDEYITLDFIHNSGGLSVCGGCDVALLGFFFVCVKCREAGKDYDLCCICYGDKSYNHVHDHNDFTDLHRLKIRKPKPASINQAIMEDLVKRMQRIETCSNQKKLQPSSSVTVNELPKSATGALFPYCIPTGAIMEDLVKTARLYYKKSSSDIKELAQKFFEGLDNDKDGKVSLHEFLGFMRQQGYGKMGNRHFFEKLDRDGNGTLDFMEVMALYYVIKSGRPFCGGCDEFIPGMYFACPKCLENGDLFYVCPKCFEDEAYVHQHISFLDNYALLESKRKQVIETHSNQQKQSSSVTITELPRSATGAVVPYRIPTRLQGLDLGMKLVDVTLTGVGIAFKLLDIAVSANHLNCAIM